MADVGPEQDLFPGIVPRDKQRLPAGVLGPDAFHLLGGHLVDQDHLGGGGNTVEKLIQEGVAIVVPPQDEDVVGFLDDFQASLPTEFSFNEDGGHGGGDQG